MLLAVTEIIIHVLAYAHTYSKAFERIKAILKPGQEDQGPTQWTLLGVQVCLRAWKRLHSLGYTVQLSCNIFLFDSYAAPRPPPITLNLLSIFLDANR